MTLVHAAHKFQTGMDESAHVLTLKKSLIQPRPGVELWELDLKPSLLANRP